jgi:hypothetical protein
MRILRIVALGAALGGCASSAADVTPAYVSPVVYQTYTCVQLTQEAIAVSALAVGGDKQTAAELSKMKGQMVAIEQASIAKKCGIQFEGQRPPGT